MIYKVFSYATFRQDNTVDYFIKNWSISRIKKKCILCYSGESGYDVFYFRVIAFKKREI